MKKLLTCLLLLASMLSFTASAQSVAFSYTGASQTYTVPLGIYQLAVVAVGAPGGRVSTGQRVPLGGVVYATITVTPGEVLVVNVGEAGNGNGQASYNGGGKGTRGAASGGGATDLRTMSTASDDYLTSRHALVVAGGGGGNDWINSPMPVGGFGGAPDGQDGVGVGISTPGQGATQSAPGGSYFPGINNLGGGGGWAGGGGGYYGGSGGVNNGPAAGGGGGSSWATETRSILGSVRYEVVSDANVANLRITPVTPPPIGIAGFAKTGPSVYPNPWTSELRVQIGGEKIEPATLTLSNSQGQVVRKVLTKTNSTEVLFDAAKLPLGTYYLQVSTPSSSQTLRVVHR